jgi:hypothetical protein
MRSRSTALMTSLANRWSISVTLAPTRKAVVSWLNHSQAEGQHGQQSVIGTVSRYSATLRAPVTMFPCDNTTPFRRPVLPEV